MIGADIPIPYFWWAPGLNTIFKHHVYIWYLNACPYSNGYPYLNDCPYLNGYPYLNACPYFNWWQRKTSQPKKFPAYIMTGSSNLSIIKMKYQCFCGAPNKHPNPPPPFHLITNRTIYHQSMWCNISISSHIICKRKYSKFLDWFFISKFTHKRHSVSERQFAYKVHANE